jgi:hypothetical protein
LIIIPFPVLLNAARRGAPSFFNIIKSLTESTGIFGNNIVCLFEEQYIDENYTDEFGAYYCKLYRIPSKYCTRIHFFFYEQTVDSSVKFNLNYIFRHAKYLGFIVVRPWCDFLVSNDKLSIQVKDRLQQRMISFSLWDPKIKNTTLIKIPNLCLKKVHFLGHSFSVYGIPYRQQDSKTGACAQSSIWVADKVMHSTFHTPRHSISKITFLGKSSSPTGRIIPSHSDEANGLTHVQMVNAVYGMGLEPLFFCFDKKERAVFWNNLFAFVSSGIPVVLICSNDDCLHAITVIGYTDFYSKRTKNPFLKSYGGIVFHDDQVAPYIISKKIDIKKSIIEYPSGLQMNIKFMIIPLPGKIYLTATDAAMQVETIESNRPTLGYRTRFSTIKEKKYGINSSSKYYRLRIISSGRLIENIQKIGKRYPKSLKEIIGQLGMPKFVWVAERYAGSGKADDVYGMSILDATAEPVNSMLYTQILNEVSWGDAFHEESIKFNLTKLLPSVVI